jgi:hypothetical protein
MSFFIPLEISRRARNARGSLSLLFVMSEVAVQA